MKGHPFSVVVWSCLKTLKPQRRKRSMGHKYVGLNVHQSSTVAAVQDEQGKSVMESILATNLFAYPRRPASTNESNITRLLVRYHASSQVGGERSRHSQSRVVATKKRLSPARKAHCFRHRSNESMAEPPASTEHESSSGRKARTD